MPGTPSGCHEGSFLGTGEPEECQTFTVIGGKYNVDGMYGIFDIIADDAPDNPVWKMDQDRYIFNTGGVNGWRIGNEAGLKNGMYYYESKMFWKYRQIYRVSHLGFWFLNWLKMSENQYAYKKIRP